MQEQRRPMAGARVEAQIRAHPAFQPLVAQRRALAWTLAALMLVIYFGFIGLVAFAPALMGMPVAGSVTLGFPLGLGVILAAIVLTGIYVVRANAAFDGMTRRIVEDAP